MLIYGNDELGLKEWEWMDERQIDNRVCPSWFVPGDKL